MKAPDGDYRWWVLPLYSEKGSYSVKEAVLVDDHVLVKDAEADGAPSSPKLKAGQIWKRNADGQVQTLLGHDSDGIWMVGTRMSADTLRSEWTRLDIATNDTEDDK